MKTGSSVVLVALAVADSLALLVGLSDHLLNNVFGIWIDVINIYFCVKVFNWWREL